VISRNEAPPTVPRTPFGEREAALLARAQRGDQGAWNDLATCYWSEVMSVCFLVLRHREDAEDACVETFIKARAALARFTGGSFGAWMTTIARNTAADELRKRRRRDATIRLVGGAQEALTLLDFVSRQSAIDRFRNEEAGYGGETLFLLRRTVESERRIRSRPNSDFG